MEVNKAMKILSFQNLIVVIIASTFFDYDIFVLLSLIALMLLYVSNHEIKFEKWQKKIIILETIVFLIFIRLFPIIKNSFLYLYNMFSQQNYLYLDGKFFSENILLDFQTFLFGMYCNKSPEETNQYNLRYTGEVIECPYSSGYGIGVELFSFNSDIWTTTIMFALFSFILIVWIYLESIKGQSEKSFIFITFFFLSPPMNFVLFRLNIDLLIFILLYFIHTRKLNIFIRNTLLLFFTFLKIYPIVFLVGFTVIDIFRSKNFRHFVNYIFLFIGIIYLIYDNLKSNTLGDRLIKTESYRAYGLANDSLYISELFNISQNIIFLILLILSILFGIFVFQKFDFSSFKIETIPYILFIIFSGLFANYDYRLIFLFFIIQSLVSDKKSLILTSFFLFLYSSPNLMYSYGRLYKINVNDDIYYFDLLFYIIFSLSIAILIQLIKLFKMKLLKTKK